MFHCHCWLHRQSFISSSSLNAVICSEWQEFIVTLSFLAVRTVRFQLPLIPRHFCLAAEQRGSLFLHHNLISSGLTEGKTSGERDTEMRRRRRDEFVPHKKRHEVKYELLLSLFVSGGDRLHGLPQVTQQTHQNNNSHTSVLSLRGGNVGVKCLFSS